MDTGFPARVNATTKILILGSMPGVISLKETQYYAHPRNGFWQIIDNLFGVDHRLPNNQRLEALLAKQVGLWDVVHQCVRPGSLDSSIVKNSVTANNFAALSTRLKQLQTIAFNGQAAAKLFKSHVIGKQHFNLEHIRLVTLPSSSPAHASLSIEEKTTRWRDQLFN